MWVLRKQTKCVCLCEGVVEVGVGGGWVRGSRASRGVCVGGGGGIHIDRKTAETIEKKKEKMNMKLSVRSKRLV